MLFFANEDYKLKCYDSTKQEVSLSGLSPACFVAQKAAKLKANNKNVLTQLSITVTPATGTIKTSLIDGSSVTFVSASGTLIGNSQKNLINSLPICLADENATILTLEASKCTKGKLVVNGVTKSSPPTAVVDVCDIWFSDAGHSKTRGN